MIGTILSQFRILTPAAINITSERITREPVPPIPNTKSFAI
jgi:hypothetical protein